MAGYNYYQGIGTTGNDPGQQMGMGQAQSTSYGSSPGAARNLSSSGGVTGDTSAPPSATPTNPQTGSNYFSSLGGYTPNGNGGSTLSAAVPTGSTYVPWFGYVGAGDTTNGLVNGTGQFGGLQDYQINALNAESGLSPTPRNIGDSWGYAAGSAPSQPHFLDGHGPIPNYENYGRLPDQGNYLGLYDRVGGKNYTPDQYGDVVKTYNSNVDSWNANPQAPANFFSAAQGGNYHGNTQLIAPSQLTHANSIADIYAAAQARTPFTQANTPYFESIYQNSQTPTYGGYATRASSSGMI